jgi:hypothetical protein
MKLLSIIVLMLSVLTLGSPKVLFGQTRATSDSAPQEAPAGTKVSKTSSNGRGNTKPSSDAEKIKQKAEALGIASRVTVVLSNGNEYYGALSQIGEDSLVLSEIDLKQQITVAYADVKKIRSGFGNPNKFNGKRWHPGWHIAAAAAAIGSVVVLLIIGATANR